MAVLTTRVDPAGAEARANAAAMRRLVADLRTRTAALTDAGAAGDARSIARHRERGKLPVRERIDRLLDPGAPFLELSALAAEGLYGGEAPGAGIVTGIGRVSGVECVVVANDATVKGGTYYPMTVKKHLRAQEIALDDHLPCLYLVDSGGAYLPLQDEVFPDRDHFGRIFYNQARMSAAGDPPGGPGHGQLHGRRRVRPGDERRDRHRPGDRHDLPGRAAAGEGGHRRGGHRGGAGRVGRPHPHQRRRRSRGARRRARPGPGARDRGLPELAQARSAVGAGGQPARRSPARSLGDDGPSDDPFGLYGVVPADLRQGYDVREVIARLVDGSEFHEFKREYGSTLVCGFAHLDGWPLGILANNGVLFSESALKGAHFIELACQRRIPLLFLQNITGFMVGREYEAGGIAKDGAKLVTAVASAEVPKFTVLIGGSFGAGNYGMAGRAYGSRGLWSWPNARISVMGGAQAARVLSTVREASLPGGGWASEAERDAFEAPILAEYERQGHPYYATARLWDDGVIDPAQTRDVLALAISAALNAPIPETRFGVFRM